MEYCELKKAIKNCEEEMKSLIKVKSWGAAEGVNQRRIHLINKYEELLSAEERGKALKLNVKAMLESLASEGEIGYYQFIK